MVSITLNSFSNRKYYFFLSFLFSFLLHSQNEWTWIKGDSVSSAKGIYGTIGVPTPANKPGCKYTALSWTDLNGNLWLYGGQGKDTGYVSSGTLSDLWKFDIITQQWTWVNGSQLTYQGTPVYGTLNIASASNNPGHRSLSYTWVDNAGDLCLFGGYGYDSFGSGPSGKNDMWKYNISTNMWTWFGGSVGLDPPASYGTVGILSPSNIPGGRSDMVGWKDSMGNVWIFGGYGVTTTSTSNLMNDLWKYDISVNQWVWLKGSIAFTQPGIYGTATIPAAANVPGARRSSHTWIDKSGFLWLYGGEGYDAASNFGALNDLWKYNTATNQWTWMKGTNAKNQLPVYGTQNILSSTNRPGGMISGATWTDSTGNFWIGNSLSINSVSSGFYTNIMWKYNVGLNQWTWVKGTNVLMDQPARFGSLGTPSITNIPGGGEWSCNWTGKNGEFWLFGGWRMNAKFCCGGAMNDLWRFNPCYTNTVIPTNTTPAPNYSVCSGQTTTLSAIGSGSVTWYNINSMPIATGTLFSTPTLTSNTTFLFGDNTSCMLSSITVTAFPNPTLNITSSNSVICIGSSSLLNALSGAAFYNWSTGATTTTISISPTITSVYNVTVTNFPSGCSTVGSKTVIVNTCTSLSESTDHRSLYKIYPNPAKSSFILEIENEISNSKMVITDIVGKVLLENPIQKGINIIELNQFSQGLYNYTLYSNNRKTGVGKILLE